MDNFGSEKDGKKNYFNDNADYILYNQQLDRQSSNKASDLIGSSRTKFIRKVYTILSFQLLLTTIMTLFSIYSQSYFLFQIQHIGLIWVAFVVVIIIEIYMFCCGGARKFPQNIILTLIFTLCQGYIVSFIASFTGRTSGNPVVLLAAASTLAITVACTLYAIFTKQDFTTSYALLIVLSVAMLILFVILLFTDSPFLHSLYCAIGVFLFGCYLVIDTQMIVGGRSIELGMDEEYVGALLLYIDIITIFIYLLQLFKGSD